MWWNLATEAIRAINQDRQKISLDGAADLIDAVLSIRRAAEFLRSETLRYLLSDMATGSGEVNRKDYAKAGLTSQFCS